MRKKPLPRLPATQSVERLANVTVIKSKAGMFAIFVSETKSTPIPPCQTRFPRHKYLLQSPSSSSFLYLVVFLIPFFAGSSCESGLVRQVHYYEEIGDADAREAYLRAELQRKPDNAEAWFYLGKTLLRKATYPEASEAFRAASARTARYDELISYELEATYRGVMQTGIQYMASTDYAGAVIAFEHATQLQPAYNAGYRMLGHALTKAERIEDASSAYAEAVTLDSEDFEAWNNLSEIAFQQQDFEHALAHGQHAHALRPDNLPVRRRLARAHLELGQADEAIKGYRALNEMSSLREDLENFAFTLFNLRRFNDAIPLLEQLTQHASADVEILRTLSEAYSGAGSYDRVILVSHQIIEAKPEDRGAIGNLVTAYEKLGQFDDAQTWQSRLAELGEEME